MILDELFAVYENGEYVQAFDAEWRAKDFILDNVDFLSPNPERRNCDRFTVEAYRR